MVAKAVGAVEVGPKAVGTMEVGAETTGAIETKAEAVGAMEEGAETTGAIKTKAEAVGAIAVGVEAVGVIEVGLIAAESELVAVGRPAGGESVELGVVIRIFGWLCSNTSIAKSFMGPTILSLNKGYA